MKKVAQTTQFARDIKKMRKRGKACLNSNPLCGNLPPGLHLIQNTGTIRWSENGNPRMTVMWSLTGF
jgi:hypothetical protein